MFFGDQYFQSSVFLFSTSNKEIDLFFGNILFKSEHLPSFEISVTGLKTILRLQPPVPVLLLQYISYVLLLLSIFIFRTSKYSNFYLLA